MKKVVSLLILFSIVLTIFPCVVSADDSKKTNNSLNLTKNATSSILIEATTGTILYKKNINKRVSIASLTKMMGLILIFENIEKGGMKYDEIITVSQYAKDQGGTQLYLDVGEKISINDLLKGIVMASANDAMVALAERVAGTEEAFVAEMNNKAKALGLKNTNFKNCTGFDEENHYSTAQDLAIIAMELVKHSDIFKFSSVYESYVRENTNNKTWVVNTNKLVRFYDGADGLKTGATDAAGKCIAATAKKGDLRLIAISLGYNDVTTRNQQTMDLLDYGFNQYTVKMLYKKGTVVGITDLEKISEKVDLVAQNDILILKKKTDQDIKYNYDITLNDVKYPIKKGDRLGTLYIKDNNIIIKKEPLVANKNINKMNIFKLYFYNIKDILVGFN